MGLTPWLDVVEGHGGGGGAGESLGVYNPGINPNVQGKGGGDPLGKYAHFDTFPPPGGRGRWGSLGYNLGLVGRFGRPSTNHRLYPDVVERGGLGYK